MVRYAFHEYFDVITGPFICAKKTTVYFKYPSKKITEFKEITYHCYPCTYIFPALWHNRTIPPLSPLYFSESYRTTLSIARKMFKANPPTHTFENNLIEKLLVKFSVWFYFCPWFGNSSYVNMKINTLQLSSTRQSRLCLKDIRIYCYCISLGCFWMLAN